MTDSFASLISDLAHDLRSPLTSLQGFSATLVRSWDRFSDEQRRDFIETIEFDARRMARLVTEVVDLARVETGRLELTAEKVLLKPVVTQSAELLRLMPGIDRLAVEVPDETWVWGDPARIGHIVTNLLELALAASEEAVTISAAERGEGAVVTIAGAGGVDAGAFERPAPRGTNYGPYLARELISAHGGSLEARDGTLVLTLPVTRKSA